MNEYNKTLQREIRSYEEAISDMKSVLDMIDHARDPRNITLSVDNKEVAIDSFGISAIKMAINGRIIHYQSAIRMTREMMI